MADKWIGIDVSEHNGTLDWAAIKKAGIKFAIIRDGYGVYHVDNQFNNNITGALAQGISVGIYWFSYALDALNRGQRKKLLKNQAVKAMMERYGIKTM